MTFSPKNDLKTEFRRIKGIGRAMTKNTEEIFPKLNSELMVKMGEVYAHCMQTLFMSRTGDTVSQSEKQQGQQVH